MRTRAPVKPVASFLFAAILACPVAVLAAPGGGGGGGGGTPDYGDLVVLYRDANGVPILSESQLVTDPETGLEVSGGLCLQPVAAVGVDIVDVDGVSIDCAKTPDGLCLIPVDQYSCSLLPGYASYAQEIEFERINVARAPEDVMARQLEDVLIGLSTADCIQLDPAGRLLYQTLDITADPVGRLHFQTQDSNRSDRDTITDEYLTQTEYLAKTVDSPLQNLAIYKELILKGQLGDPAIVLPQPWARYGFLDQAAKALGAATSKEGAVNVDLVVYLNQIMGLSDEATATVLDPKICIDYRDEVQGQMVMVHECFLDYSDYAYRRRVTYRSLPYPAYLPEEGTIAGVFEYLAFLQYDEADRPLFHILDARILPTVWPSFDTLGRINGALPGFTGGNIGGIAQAADDARAVILFGHNNPIPAGWATPPLACTGGHQIAYDVSINATSGLAVPVMMVANDDGREVIVTVGNSGPDAATGRVTVVGVLNGTTVADKTARFTDLAAGAGKSWAFMFVAPEVGTVSWTATVTAPDDAYLPNNTVTGTTEVMAGGGGGGGE
jgi:hypothetical protein